jgi:drug/metabolite transporter (DMT)-like permease
MQECRPEIADAVAIEAPDVEEGGSALAPRSKSGTYLVGAAWALFAISIWAGWFVSTRFNITTNLTAFDLVALRFGVAAIILLPVAIRLRGGIGSISLGNALAVFAGSGVVYSLCSTLGVAFAPPADAAALTPGIMPMATALLGAILFKERINKAQGLGFSLILVGALAIGGLGLFQGEHQAWVGHLLFVIGAFLFAGYTIALRRSGLTGLQATALVALWSSFVYIPVYFLALKPRILELATDTLVFPAFYQGVLTNVVSLVAYGRAVSILGATRAAAFAALIPAVTAILSVFILHEVPSSWEWTAIGSVSIGVYLASGAPLPKYLI